MSDKNHTSLRPNGFMVWADRESDKVVMADTFMCCHCGLHEQINPGSGKRRGYCSRCAKFTCGRKCCDVCIPIEQRLDNMDAGLGCWSEYRPITASVPRTVGNGNGNGNAVKRILLG